MADTLMDSLRLVRPALSHGGVESLVYLPSRTFHNDLTPEERRHL